MGHDKIMRSGRRRAMGLRREGPRMPDSLASFVLGWRRWRPDGGALSGVVRPAVVTFTLAEGKRRDPRQVLRKTSIVGYAAADCLTTLRTHERPIQEDSGPYPGPPWREGVKTEKMKVDCAMSYFFSFLPSVSFLFCFLQTLLPAITFLIHFVFQY